LFQAWRAIIDFVETGGGVLIVIAGVPFCMWTLICEVRHELTRGLSMIHAFVATCPMPGLLGTLIRNPTAPSALGLRANRGERSPICDGITWPRWRASATSGAGSPTTSRC